jgi:hypothetical protein
MQQNTYIAKRGKLPTSAAIVTCSLLAMAISLSGCGGGGGSGDTKIVSTGTGDPTPPPDALAASGPLSTVGTAGISATNFDDRASSIFINTQAGQSFTALKLGMVAEVTGTIPTSATSTTPGTANTIVVQSAVVGLVTFLDPVNQSFGIGANRDYDPGRLLVRVDQNTIFEGLDSLSNLSVFSRVEVYGVPLAAYNTILATRLILLPDAADPKQAELLGVATFVSATQFSLQGAQVATTSVSEVTTPSGIVPGTTSIAEGARVRVLGRLDAFTRYGGGQGPVIGYLMSANKIVAGIPIVRNDNSIIVLDGIVQSIGANSRFRLNDTDVDPPAANAAAVTVGARVQVKGRKTAGVLTATDFRLVAAAERIQYTVQGDISSFISTANFTVRGETINASTATFVGGTAASLANGRTVRIKAQVTGGHLMATEVTLL